MGRLIKICSVLLALVLLTACATSGGNGPIVDSQELRLTADSDKIVIFAQGAPFGFWARNDQGNGPPFNCVFSQGNAVVGDGTLTLSLTQSGNGFAGAEYRSWERFSYGFYSVSMKAAACSGVISSFFTYCGYPWDEIDIEFLGNDTTKVQFNYYTRGAGNHEYIYDLGFDASADYHEYAFDWQPDSITWYVDGKPVYKATDNIPSSPGNIMMNIWNVADSTGDWAGKLDVNGLPVYAQYQWIGYRSAKNDA